MEIEIPTAKIYIIEGIAGAGKNTLHAQLKEKLKDKIIYDFNEEDLLFSWKHGWIKDIDAMRLTFQENFLDYCAKVISENSKAVFILERFHISYRFFTLLQDVLSEARYEKTLQRLKDLSTFIFVPIIDNKLIESRSSHLERVDPVWKIHLEKRLKQRGCATLQEMYSLEQKKIIELLEQQGLPYRLVEVPVKIN